MRLSACMRRYSALPSGFTPRSMTCRRGCAGLEGPADERGEAAGGVLLIAQALQMFDAIVERLDVAEHHRRARIQAELVRDRHDFEPLVALALQRRDLVAHAIDENLAATAGDRCRGPRP